MAKRPARGSHDGNQGRAMSDASPHAFPLALVVESTREILEVGARPEAAADSKSGGPRLPAAELVVSVVGLGGP
eukprot:4567540-Pyramimonas_sp.AAC.1